MTPEQLLFTDRAGRSAQLADVIDDGLDGGYDARLPALVELMRTGAPYHRLLACLVLASWNVDAGLEALIAWARAPDATPWRDQPVSVDRRLDVDDAFARLADALRASLIASDGAASAMQVDAARALLGLAGHRFLGSSLTAALGRDALATRCLDELDGAIAACVAGVPERALELAVQAAELIGVLARHRDDAAAAHARALVARAPGERALVELAGALGRASGRATRAALDDLAAASAGPRVDAAVAQALARRVR
jgi:hypothetical protein